MYRDAEEIEREKILLGETSSSGTFELCFKYSITIHCSTNLLRFDALLSKVFVHVSLCAIEATYNN